MRRYTTSPNRSRSYHQKNQPNPIYELRRGRAAFGQAAIRFESAALSLRCPRHAAHCSTLARLALEAARPIGRIIRQLELEVHSV